MTDKLPPRTDESPPAPNRYPLRPGVARGTSR